ncbi:nucleotide sugar dehydrogenase [Cytobacillus sp. FJAT-53684]|uniref:Nucleotide sugar dehydrogenase n=1 Tax=Cytobacillus mangrovibacter TaxID=3299024 RepID=A0ABW6JT34_9BACI
MERKKDTSDFNPQKQLIDTPIEETVIGVIGLGYVGLPVAVAFAEKYRVIGFDVNKKRISSLENNIDETGEIPSNVLQNVQIEFTSKEIKLKECNFFIVAVPTPITSSNMPDLTSLEHASRTIGRNLSKGSIIVYESTVYPGATEEICIPLLEAHSQLKSGKEFHVGYSPERINPGDKEHFFKSINKIVSAQDKDSLKKIQEIYQNVIDADIYLAPSIKVAEAAKVVENTQRDVNIAFMNELAIIFEQMNIDTYEVIKAAGTKWNFLPFSPGLVGGHCIGVDPYYLIHKSKTFGYNPELLSTARKINDYMPEYIAHSLLKLVITNKFDLANVNISILGISFKENIPDIRNSKALELVQILQEYGLNPQICDPYVNNTDLAEALGIHLTPINSLEKADIVILAVAHKEFRDMSEKEYNHLLKNQSGVIMDLKNILSSKKISKDVQIWKL